MKRHGLTGKIMDDAEVSPNAVLNYSTAKDQCLIVSGEWTDCTLGGNMKAAGWPTAVSSFLACDFIGGAPVILDSSCFGDVRIYDTPQLENVTLNGQIAIYGNAVIKNWHLSVTSDDFLRVHAGVWLRAPRFIDVGKYIVSECSEGRIHVGCKCRTAEYWLSHYRFGVRLGVDAAAIKAFILSLNDAAKVPQVSAAH